MLRQIVRVSKFWREYTGEQAVEAIDDKVMREFIPWRRDYYASFKELPKNAKLNPTDKRFSGI
jgi:integrase